MRVGIAIAGVGLAVRGLGCGKHADEFICSEAVVGVLLHLPLEVTHARIGQIKTLGHGLVGDVEDPGPVAEELAQRDLVLVGDGEAGLVWQIWFVPARHGGGQHVVDLQQATLVEKHDRGGSEGLRRAGAAEVALRRDAFQRGGEGRTFRREGEERESARLAPVTLLPAFGEQCRERIGLARACR